MTQEQEPKARQFADTPNTPVKDNAPAQPETPELPEKADGDGDGRGCGCGVYEDETDDDVGLKETVDGEQVVIRNGVSKPLSEVEHYDHEENPQATQEDWDEFFGRGSSNVPHDPFEGLGHDRFHLEKYIPELEQVKRLQAAIDRFKDDGAQLRNLRDELGKSFDRALDYAQRLGIETEFRTAFSRHYISTARRQIIQTGETIAWTKIQESTAINAGKSVASFVPIAGEAMDLHTLFWDPEASGFDKFMSGVSLGANALTLGFLPNWGGVRGGLNAANDTLRSGSDATAGLAKAGGNAVDNAAHVSKVDLANVQCNVKGAGNGLPEIPNIGKVPTPPPTRGIGGRGWRGDRSWRDTVKRISRGDTIELPYTPTRQEAIDLVAEAGGSIDRIELGHLPPNPHQWPHVNYTTADGVKGTLRILGLD